MAIEVVGGSIVSKITELLVEPVIKQFRYMFCFNNFVQEFDEQMLNMALALYRLQDDVDVAKRNAVEIDIDVNKWLEDAKNEMEGVNRLGNEKGKNGKCFTWCPKWIPQFKLSKALEKKTETLRKLEEKSKEFPRVSHKAPLQDIEFLPSNEFTRSESSNEAFEQIMKALKDDNVNMIGLYGMGGVGKTTLVKEVGRRAKETQLFDKVLLAPVSQNPNVMYIQDRMAESLGLKFDEKTTEGRASRLWKRLETEKKLLIILDDVWKAVNLKEIGIPVGVAHRGCKVLLTTRLGGICSYMECQQKVHLNILSENEAWALFKINAGLSAFNLNTVAEKVARECQGLPIALVTVGRALRDKSTDEWEQASKDLKNSQFQHTELIGEEKNIYSCLKFSYDYLQDKKTKLCFLLCCLFPEDYDIPIEDLTRYTVGYGLHQDVESIEDARKQDYVAIKTLKDCCMLLGTEYEGYVKMHDLVRDVAIQIASSKEHGFMVKAGIGLKEWPRSNKSFEGYTTISLMGNQLTELPEGLVFPHLKVLLLELDDDLNVPERFFEGMKEIEVLSLEGGCLSLQSLEFSTNLKSLLLIHCECNDVIWLRKLQRLEILGFIWCSSLEELPDEIEELKELRLLDVTGCSSLRRIPVNLIGRLKKLEELLIGNNGSFEGWGVVGCDGTGGMNASLTELNLLSHLAVLSLKIPRVECIPRDFVFPRLLKYDIVLGYRDYSIAGHPTSTRLYLRDISVASLNAKTFEQLFPTVSQIGFRNVEGLENIALSCDQMTNHGHGSQKDFFQRLEDVEVNGCRDTRTLFPAKWRQALNNLTSVEIGDCESLEVVFELGEAGEGINEEKELRLLSSLTRLKLIWLHELKCIWKGPTRHVSLRSLVHVKLWSLHKLTFIFTPHLAQSLVHLETLQISNCGELKHLIGEKDDEREIIPESLGFLKLKTLLINGCDKLEYVFPVSVSPSLLNLEEMEIEFGANLKQIFYRGEGDALTKDGIINFPQLRKLTLSRPKNFTAQLPSLQVLAIEGHEELGNFLAQLQGHTNLREIRITDCEGAHDLMLAGHELSLLSLETLKLSSMPDMRCIWKGLVLSHLTTLEVFECHKLTHVFTGSLVASLVQLQFLDIYGCSELEQIIAKDNDDEKDQILSGSDLQSLCFPNLLEIEIRGCNKLRSLFPVAMAIGLPKLQRLEVTKSSQLLGVFGKDDHASPVYVEKQMVFPNLSFLRLYKLPSIVCFSPGCDDFLFPNLCHVEIKGCNKLRSLFPVAMASGLPELQRLVVRDSSQLLGLIQDSLGFPELKTLSISGCDKLEYVFPVSVSPSLLNLEEITIVCCANLKQIFYSGEGDALTRDGIINFPRLRELSLSSGCSFFGPKNFTAQLPSLQVLSIDGHEELGDLLAQLQGLTNLRTIFITSCKGAQHLMQARSFVPNRRTGHEWWQALKNLETMKIKHCESLEEVFELGEAGEGINEEKELLLSLTRLEMKLLPELKCIWKGPTRHVSLRSLVYLKLQGLDKLTFIFTLHLAQSLVHLETLRIHGCGELKHLIREKDDEREITQESLRFPKLKTLLISGCDKLEYVFLVSVSPSLLNLEEMEIEFGANLKQIFYSGEGDALTRDCIINFPQLRKLCLSSGCNFFGPKHFTAQLPSLKVLAIDGHEELGDLLAQLQGHTNLREICITDCKGAHDRRTGHELSLLSLERLELNSMPDMRCIWKGLVLSHLTFLKVFECHKLTHVFTGSLVASLVQLKNIVIVGCSELEQIIAKDNDDEKDQILSGSDLQSLCFPNLRGVVIRGCNKLRSLFPVAMASGLPELQRLVVRDSSQLLGVFGQDDHASPVNVEKQMEFPNLSSLWLENLPSIVCFSLGCDDFLFPCLKDLTVDECPKLTTQFPCPRKTNGSTSAQSEVSQSSEDSSTSCSEPIKVD